MLLAKRGEGREVGEGSVMKLKEGGEKGGCEIKE